MIREARAHGKLILFGEHTAVFGNPAVGISLKNTIHMRWQNNSTEHSSADGSKVGAQAKISKGFRDESTAVLKLLQYAGLNPNDFGLSEGQWLVDNHILRSCGFGSSASFCVAIARILLDQKSFTYNAEVHHLAHRLEKKFHGNPSGIDTGLVSMAGLSAWFPIEKDIPQPEFLQFSGLRILFGAVPRIVKTAESVGNIVRTRNEGDKQTIQCLKDLGEISREFIYLVRQSRELTLAQLQQIGNMVKASQELLVSLGLSTIHLDKLIHEAVKLGALAGKLSGAGMGGAFYIVVPDEDVQYKILRELPPILKSTGVKLIGPLQSLILV